MALEAINGNTVSFKQVVSPNLKPKQNFTSKPEVDEEKSNAASLMIGATALATLIGFGIAGRKGYLGKSIKNLLGGATKPTNNMEKPINNLEEAANGLRIGPKKKIVDGKAYTGVVNTSKAKITYKDGYIVSSKLPNSIVKDYYRDVDGRLRGVTVSKAGARPLEIVKMDDGSVVKTQCVFSGSPDFNLASGRKNVDQGRITYKTTITPDGNIKKVKIEEYRFSNPNFRNGRMTSVRRDIDLVTGKIKTSNNNPVVPRPLMYPSYKYNGHRVIDGKNYSVCCGEDGKIYSACHGSYNPKNMVITKEYYEMRDGKLVPTFTDQIDKEIGYKLTRFEDGRTFLNISHDEDLLNAFDGNYIVSDVGKIKQIIAKKGLNFDI